MAFVNISGGAFGSVGESIDTSHFLTIPRANPIYVNQTGDNMSGVLNMRDNKIINLSAPTDPNDAVCKKYVDAQDAETKTVLVSDFVSRGNSFKELQSFWKGIDLKNTKITNL